MKRLVYSKRWKVQLWSLGFYDTYIYGRIFFVKNLFTKGHFEIKMAIPYIENPTFDGEYSTNKILKSLAISCRTEMEIKAYEILRKYNRIKQRL